MNQFTIYIDKDLTPRWNEFPKYTDFEESSLGHYTQYDAALQKAKEEAIPFDKKDHFTIAIMMGYRFEESDKFKDSFVTIDYDGTVERRLVWDSKKLCSIEVARLIPSKPKEEKQNTIVDMQKFGQIEKEFGDVSTPEKPDNKPDFEAMVQAAFKKDEIGPGWCPTTKRAVMYGMEKLYSDIYLPKVKELEASIRAGDRLRLMDAASAIDEANQLRDKLKTLEEERDSLHRMVLELTGEEDEEHMKAFLQFKFHRKKN